MCGICKTLKRIRQNPEFSGCLEAEPTLTKRKREECYRAVKFLIGEFVKYMG